MSVVVDITSKKKINKQFRIHNLVLKKISFFSSFITVMT